jgi:hypothetical protein
MKTAFVVAIYFLALTFITCNVVSCKHHQFSKKYNKPKSQ